MAKQRGFQIPASFINQLEEYTRGYMLIVCNEKGELSAYEAYDNPVIKLGLINFADMHVSAEQRHMHDVALKAEEQSNEISDEPEDET